MSQAQKNGFVSFLQEFSIPLIGGVLVALAFANLAPEAYASIIGWEPVPGFQLLGHAVTFQFLIDDIFMALFFGMAAKEITESVLPGGALNPIRNAINPLLATVGGVLGPVAVFFALLHLTLGMGAFEGFDPSVLSRGWGVPTATDIALAWLVARAVFGAGHPAVNFLLLLAVADDAIGLVIIAVFYGDPAHPAQVEWLLLLFAGMALAFVLRRLRVPRWEPYIFVAGPLAWTGLALAHLHPAVALVAIVPFMPGPRRDTGLFRENDEVDEDEAAGVKEHHAHSPLHLFEHQLKLFIDIGLFFFAFANAGVAFAGIGAMTWIILGSLVIGKVCGISLFGWLGSKIGFPLPPGMGLRQLVMAGFIAALGLTVALFVAAAAFTDPGLLGQAKMGALFSGFVGLVAILIAKPLKMRG